MADTNKRALIIWGGWVGHEPAQVASIFAAGLREHGLTVTVADTLDALLDVEKLQSLDLIAPCAVRQPAIRRSSGIHSRGSHRRGGRDGRLLRSPARAPAG
jgi:type 1 glutamine amidotransferase